MREPWKGGGVWQSQEPTSLEPSDGRLALIWQSDCLGETLFFLTVESESNVPIRSQKGDTVM